MPVLTNAKHERFAQEIVKCSSSRDAYKAAGYNSKSDSVADAAASRLLSDVKIQGRIAELQGRAAEKVALNRSWVLERLMRNARITMGEEKVKITVKPKDSTETIDLDITMRDAGAANRALELLGKTEEAAVFIDRVEHTGKDGAPLMPEPSNRDIARAIADILRTAKVEEAGE
jgi:phage terminase small subunit